MKNDLHKRLDDQMTVELFKTTGLEPTDENFKALEKKMMKY